MRQTWLEEMMEEERECLINIILQERKAKERKREEEGIDGEGGGFDEEVEWDFGGSQVVCCDYYLVSNQQFHYLFIWFCLDTFSQIESWLKWCDVLLWMIYIYMHEVIQVMTKMREKRNK